MVQPDVAGIMLNDRLLADQGLLSQFLITAPDSAAGLRLWHEPKPESGAVLKRYGARLLGILEELLLLAPRKSNELEPRCLTLSSQARGLWIAFADHVERAIAPMGAPEISANHVRAGIALAEHYATEALHVYGASRVNSDLRIAQRVLDWLLGTWSEPAINTVTEASLKRRSMNEGVSRH